MAMALEKFFVNGARKSAVAGVEVFLAEVPLKSPTTAPEKVLDTCRSHVRLETPRGRYDECSSKFSLRKETKVIEPVGLEEWTYTTQPRNFAPT